MIDNKPMASVKAKPNKVNCHNLFSLLGFLLKASNKLEKTKPIPTPAPVPNPASRPSKKLPGPRDLNEYFCFVFTFNQKTYKSLLLGAFFTSLLFISFYISDTQFSFVFSDTQSSLTSTIFNSIGVICFWMLTSALLYKYQIYTL